MKKLLVAGFLSVAALNGIAVNARACLPEWCHCLCSNRYANICCRPYNAFTPSPCCAGFIPPPAMPYCMCGPSVGMCAPSYGPGYCSSDCCDGGALPAPGGVPGIPQEVMQNLPPGVQIVPPGAQIVAPGTPFIPPGPQIVTPGMQMVPPGAQMVPPGVQTAPAIQSNPVPQLQAAPPQTLNQTSYVVPMQMQPAYNYGPMPTYAPAPANYYGQGQVPAYWYGR